jgi:hypothetical protein
MSQLFSILKDNLKSNRNGQVRPPQLHTEKPATIEHVNIGGFENFTGKYFFSSDRGIYFLADGAMLKLLDGHTYGIALRDGVLFTATDDGSYSQVLRCELPDKLDAGQKLIFEPIYQTHITERGSRIHQIAWFNDSLAVSQTSTNSIVLLSPHTGEVEQEIIPLRDENGQPRSGDYNHLNSVSQCGEVLLFCAYSANYRADGDTALLGLVCDNKVKGYTVKHRGAHDFYIAGRSVYYCDSLGSKNGSPLDDCGFLKINNQPFAPEYFGKPPGYFVRGMCRQGDEFIIGHSHKGTRKKRFEGTGSLLRCNESSVLEEVSAPFAQIYDFLSPEGTTFPEAPGVTTWDEVNQLMESIFGAPEYQMELL